MIVLRGVNGKAVRTRLSQQQRAHTHTMILIMCVVFINVKRQSGTDVVRKHRISGIWSEGDLHARWQQNIVVGRRNFGEMYGWDNDVEWAQWKCISQPGCRFLRRVFSGNLWRWCWRNACVRLIVAIYIKKIVLAAIYIHYLQSKGSRCYGINV